MSNMDIAMEALQIIAGERQCLDNLMSDKEVAKEALRRIRALPRRAPIEGYNIFNGGQGD